MGYLLLVEDIILDSCNVDLGLVRENCAAFFEEFISDSDYRIEHAFI